MYPLNRIAAKPSPVGANQQAANVAAVLEPVREAAGARASVRQMLQERGPEAACRECERLNLATLRESEEGYRLLFENNPIPMWVFDRQRLRFLAVNHAAVRQYGFTEQEFLAMAITDIRPQEDVPDLLADVAKRSEGLQAPGTWRHRRKNGEILHVEIACHSLKFHGIEAMLVAADDVTERKRSEELLQNSEMKYRAVFEDSADAYWLTDEKSVLDCNSAALRMFGYESRETMPHPAELSPPLQPDGTPSREGAARHIAVVLRDGKERFEWVHQRRNGESFQADVSMTALTLSGRRVMLGTVRDITERKRAEESLLFKTALLEAQAETTIDGILVVDGSGRILLANRQFGALFGLPPALLLKGNDLLLRQHVADAVESSDIFLAKASYLHRHREEKSRDEIRLKDGKTLELYSGPMVDAAGVYRGRIWYFRDITARKAAEERSNFLAYYDSLTGLPHRALLQERLDQALASARQKNERVAVLFLDLDRFKVFNDSLGHEFGDQLLKRVAERLKRCARAQDTVARIGGDEFILVLNTVKDTAAAGSAAKRIMKALARDFTIEGRPVNIGCSLGVSLFPEHGADWETLIKNADVAMYCAKEGGRNNFRFFTEEMHIQALERSTIESNLRRALEHKEFFLVYQPQMEIESGRITGVEVLIRWQHPEMGLVMPDKFIPIAENSGLILPIGEWVLRTACAQARKWQQEELLAGPMAVNVSAVQFRQDGFVNLIRRVLQETGLPPEQLELELTEGLLLQDAEMTFSVLQELKEMGLKLAIDDFGTGYSSLSYLRQFPVSKLKIDRSFVRDLDENPDDAVITIAIINMAKSLKLRVIAEGVESEAQLSFLRDRGCHEIQGYYFSRPVTAAEVSEMLSHSARTTRRVLTMPMRSC
jgi:diguanylate cyclase (GGDEF)-like protein/PAS domain S-box-containing protein